MPEQDFDPDSNNRAARPLPDPASVSGISNQEAAEQALRRSEELNRRIIESIPGGIVVVAPNGSIRKVNAEAERFLGLSFDAVTQMYVSDFGQVTIGEDGHEFKVEDYPVSRCLRTGEPQPRVTIGVKAPNGQVNWGVFTAIPLTDPRTGVPDGAVVMFLDITDRRMMEQALREREARSERALHDQSRLLSLIMDNMGDGVAMCDREVRFLLFNPAAERIIGVKPEGPMPASGWASYFGFYLPDRVTPFPSHDLPLQRALRGQITDSQDIYIRREDQSEGRWISTTARPIVDESGAVVGGVTVIRDLTERKRVEEALGFSEERFRLLVDQSPISIQLLSRAGYTLRVNGAFERLFGVGVQDLLDYNVLEDKQLAANGVLPLLQKAFAGEAVVIPRIAYVPNRGPLIGQNRWVRANAYPVKGRNQEVREVVILHEDVTEQKAVEDRLRESERHYRDLSEHNQLLAREVEHRVGNHLAALLGLVGLMRRRSSDVDSFADAMEGRLRGMAHVHRMMSSVGWRSVQLATLVNSTLAAAGEIGHHQTELKVQGPDAPIAPKQALALSLILLEWYTNSCKHGAHSVAGGKLDVAWSLTQNGNKPMVRLIWREENGPRPIEPMPASLGTELVGAFATRELGGRCQMHFPPEGAEHVLEFPLADRT